MKLFKWIAADPEKLDKTISHHVLVAELSPEWIFFDPAINTWCWADERRVEPWKWHHIQVAVDAEVSEGAFGEWAAKNKYWFYGTKWFRWMRDITEDYKGSYSAIEPNQRTTAELYQEFLKQLL